MPNVFIVGDVHGNYPKLITGLTAHGYQPGDDIIFVGDLMDRGAYNAKVARFVHRLGDKAHVIQGNHEFQHQNMMLHYQTIVNFGPDLCSVVSDIFKFYKQNATWPKTKDECRPYQCSLKERENIIAKESTSFSDAITRFIVYTMAWEDIRLWDIVRNVLDIMCGHPYDAEHTLYEYFAATQKTRDAMEHLWNSEAKEIHITVHSDKYDHILVTHNNPFGYCINARDPEEGRGPLHKRILYVFGHIPVEKPVFTQGTAGCGYLDIDLSPKNVGIYKLNNL